ncbi:hypothetical protein E2C01_074504 [Portunus trituberculatus]|uniref:Uncharacterized protein n=1 Tax=Portunus trituberculatus TaxID=210409 RepID=A0A5B7IHE8_PORTR|nr:hypothetical protein [Portunus trituberculatus]
MENSFQHACLVWHCGQHFNRILHFLSSSHWRHLGNLLERLVSCAPPTCSSKHPVADDSAKSRYQAHYSRQVSSVLISGQKWPAKSFGEREYITFQRGAGADSLHCGSCRAHRERLRRAEE